MLKSVATGDPRYKLCAKPNGGGTANDYLFKPHYHFKKSCRWDVTWAQFRVEPRGMRLRNLCVIYNTYLRVYVPRDILGGSQLKDKLIITFLSFWKLAFFELANICRSFTQLSTHFLTVDAETDFSAFLLCFFPCFTKRFGASETEQVWYLICWIRCNQNFWFFEKHVLP